jgi:UDP-glucose 4-epimerase
MLRGEQPMIHGDGEQSRDFTYIDNVVNGNLLACHAPAEVAAGGYFNVATNQRITLNATFAILKELTGYTGSPEYGPDRAGDVKHSLADITLASKHLGYQPTVDFKDGLRQTVAWYREQSLAVTAGGG